MMWMRVSTLCRMQNAEFWPRIICGLSDAEKLAEFSIVCSVTKAVVCYLLNKCMATFTIVPYCQQIAKCSAPVIPQSIRGRIPHSTFWIPQSIFTRTGNYYTGSTISPLHGEIYDLCTHNWTQSRAVSHSKLYADQQCSNGHLAEEVDNRLSMNGNPILITQVLYKEGLAV